MAKKQGKMTELGKFIHDEAVARYGSVRKMSEAMPEETRISHTAINDVISGKTADPGINILALIAVALHTDICTLVGYAKPEAVTFNPEVRRIAERIAGLPTADQEQALTFYMGLIARRGNETD